MRQQHDTRVYSAWITAVLQRAKRIPRFERLMNRDGAKILSPEEARQEQQRHNELAQRLAPDAAQATETEDLLKEFAERQNQQAQQRAGSSKV